MYGVDNLRRIVVIMMMVVGYRLEIALWSVQCHNSEKEMNLVVAHMGCQFHVVVVGIVVVGVPDDTHMGHLSDIRHYCCRVMVVVGHY